MGNTPDKRGLGTITHRTYTQQQLAIKSIGNHGEITIDQGPNGEFIGLRVWRGTGSQEDQFTVPLVPDAGPTAALPVARVFPPVSVANYTGGTPITIQHELGYSPIVSVIDADTDMQILAQVVYDDPENVTITMPANGNYNIYLV